VTYASFVDGGTLRDLSCHENAEEGRDLPMDVLSAVSRESTYITSLARTFWRLRGVRPQSPVTIVDIVEGWARRTPANPAVLCGDATVTYHALNAAADRYACWAHAQGNRPRRLAVALLMENRPEYLFAWLASLQAWSDRRADQHQSARGGALAHSIAISGTRHIVIGVDIGR